MRIAFVIALFLFSTLAGVHAEEVSIPTTRITLDLPAGDAAVVLAVLFGYAGRTYTLDPALEGKTAPALSVVDVALPVALRFILKVIGATYSMEGETYHVYPAKTDTGRPATTETPKAPKQRQPAQGMTRYEVTSLMGAPVAKSASLNGDELWYYSDWIVRFHATRVRLVDSANTTSLTFKASDKPIPYVEMIRKQQEAQMAAAAIAAKGNKARADERQWAIDVARRAALVQAYDPGPKSGEQSWRDAMTISALSR